MPGPDYEEDEEEYEEAPPVHQYIVDDLIRGESAALGSRKLRVQTYAFFLLETLLCLARGLWSKNVLVLEAAALEIAIRLET